MRGAGKHSGELSQGLRDPSAYLGNSLGWEQWPAGWTGSGEKVAP